MDFGGELHQFYHSSGLNSATYARCQEILCVTRASACHHALNDSRFKIRLFINHPRTSSISYAGNENDKHRSTILSTMLLDYSISR